MDETMEQALIVEDVLESRRWLKEIVLAAFPDCHVHDCGSKRAGIAAAARSHYDLALVDLGLPDGSGIDVLHRIRVHSPQTVCVVTTVLGDDEHIVAALSAGAQGYLLKEQPADVQIRQLQQLLDGIPALSPPVARRMLEHFRVTRPIATPEADLTAREREVLTLIARGLRVTDVAQALELSEHTVADYIKTIYRKLNIGSRAEAALHASRMGLLTPKK